MGYRSHSNDSRASPSQSNGHNGLERTPTLSNMNPPQPSPNASPYMYGRQPQQQYSVPPPNNGHQHSPHRQPYAPPQGYYAYAPSAVDMPRSLSYPSAYAPYANYMPSMSSPALAPGHNIHPSLSRHNTTSGIGEGLAGMDLGRPNMGFAFANRLPLVERPFKCDECVQSFVSCGSQLNYHLLIIRTAITI